MSEDLNTPVNGTIIPPNRSRRTAWIVAGVLAGAPLPLDLPPREPLDAPGGETVREEEVARRVDRVVEDDDGGSGVALSQTLDDPLGVALDRVAPRGVRAQLVARWLRPGGMRPLRTPHVKPHAFNL